jgi:peptidyl-tRNA hydrolase ICT1
MEYLTPILPRLLHQPIRQSRFYAAKSDSILIQADDSRKQADNASLCFAKLHNMVTEAATMALPGETSPEQKARVKTLQKRENEQRLKMKKTHSSKKAARRGGDGE